MHQQIRCTGCGSNLKVGEKYFGKTVACPNCKTKLRIETPTAEPLVELAEVATDPLADPMWDSFPTPVNTPLIRQPIVPTVPEPKAIQPQQKIPQAAVWALAAGLPLVLIMGAVVVWLSLRSPTTVAGKPSAIVQSTDGEVGLVAANQHDPETLVNEPQSPSAAPSSDIPTPAESEMPGAADQTTQPNQVLEIAGGKLSGAFEIVRCPVRGRLLTLPPDCAFRSIAVSQSSGDLAITLYQKDFKGVLILRRETLDAMTNEVEAPITLPAETVAFKQYQGATLLLLGARDKLWVLDAETLQHPQLNPPIEGEFDLVLPNQSNQLWVQPLTTEDESDSYVYAPSNDSSGPLIELNLATKKVDFNDSNPVDPYDIHYGQSLAKPVDPFGSMSIEPHNMLLTPAPDDPWDVQRQGLVAGLHFFRDRPWILSHNLTQLQFIHRNNFAEFHRIPLPEQLCAKQMYSNTPPATALFDEARERLIVTTSQNRQSVWFLSMKEVELPDYPLTAVHVKFPPASQPLSPGTTYRFLLSAPDDRASVTLREAPDGASIIDNEVVWTPAATDIGTIEWALDVTSDNPPALETFTHTSTVSHPVLAIDFPVYLGRISVDGGLVVAWNNHIEDRRVQSTPHRHGVVVFDTAANKVLQQHYIPAPIRDAAFFQKHVLLLSADGYTIDIYRVSDWNLVRKVSLTSELVDIEIIDNNLLAEDTLKAMHVLQLPEFQPRSILPQFNRNGVTMDSVRRVVDGWQMGHSVVNASLDHCLSQQIVPQIELRQLSNPYRQSVTVPDVNGDKQFVRAETAHFLHVEGKINDGIPSTLDFGDTKLSVEEIELPNVAATLPNRQLRLNLASDLAAKSVDLATYRWTGGTPSLLYSNGVLAVFANQQLYIYRLESLGIQVPTPNATSELAVLPQPSLPIILTRQPATIDLKITGGAPPYKIAHDVQFDTDFRIDAMTTPGLIESTDTKLTINPQKLYDSLFRRPGQEIVHTIEDFVRSSRMLASMRAGNTEALLKPQSDRLKQTMLETKKFINEQYQLDASGLPMVLNIGVIVTDSQNGKVTCNLPLIWDIPAKELIAAAKANDAKGKNVVKVAAVPPNPSTAGVSPTSLELEALAKVDPFHQFVNVDRRSPDLPLAWQATKPHQLSDAVRKMWPPLPFDNKKHSVEALAVRALIEESEMEMKRIASESTVSFSYRTGVQVKAIFYGFFDHRVRVELPNIPGESTIEWFAISNESTVDFLVKAQPLFSKPKVAAADSILAAWERNGDRFTGALNGFYADYGCLPPAAIVSEEGKPLLSWRVLMLPYFGYSKLFSLFHLDEPWDSPHNIRLLPYVPRIYVPTVDDADIGKATLQALVGNDTCFPDDLLRRRGDFIASPNDALLFAESTAAAAVAWTSPSDFKRDDSDLEQNLAHKITKSLGRPRPGNAPLTNKFFTGVMLGRGLLPLPLDEEAIWNSASIKHDGIDIVKSLQQ